MKNSVQKLLIGATCAPAINASAKPGVVQYLVDINYFNPAMLNSVKKMEFILGCDLVNPRLKFEGTSIGGTGSVTSDEYDPLPYGRFAYRVSPKVVLGFSVTEPYYAHIDWGDSILKYVSIRTSVRTTRYEPQISYQVTDSLALGFSFEITHFYDYNLDWAAPGFGRVDNISSATNYGFSAGFFYVINPCTFIDAAYHTNGGLFPLTGSSSSESGLSTNNFIINGEDPPVAYLELIRVVNSKLTVGGKIFYSRWSEVQTFTYQNTVVAPNLAFETDFKDVWSLLAYTNYDFNDKISGKFGAIYESDFSRLPLNSVSYPGSTALGFALSADIHHCNWTIAPTYMKYLYVPDAKLDNAFNQGSASLNGTVYGLRITYAE